MKKYMFREAIIGFTSVDEIQAVVDLVEALGYKPYFGQMGCYQNQMDNWACKSRKSFTNIGVFVYLNDTYDQHTEMEYHYDCTMSPTQPESWAERVVNASQFIEEMCNVYPSGDEQITIEDLI